MEEKKEAVLCDFATGICGPADTSNGVMEFVDLSKVEEKASDSIEETQEE